MIMERLTRAARRLLLCAGVGFGCWMLGVGSWALDVGAEGSGESFLPADHPIPDVQHPAPDAHVIRGAGWMDRDGDRVADALEETYRRTGAAGLQARGGPRAADVMICLDHPPTE